MSFTSICAPINEQLVDIYGEHAPQTKDHQNGFLRAALDDYNRAGIRAMGVIGNQLVPITQMNGNVREVIVFNQKRNTPDQVTDSEITCMDTEFIVDDNYSQSYNVLTDGFVANIAFSIDDADVRQLCQGKGSWVQTVFALKMDAMRTAINRKLITKASTMFGNYENGDNSGSDPIALNLITSMSGVAAANYIGGETLMTETLMDARVKGIPMVIGNGDLRTYMSARKIGCCNLTGVNLSAPVDYAWFADSDVGNILGDKNLFFALEAGAFTLIPVPFYKGEYARVTANFAEHGTIVDPLYGLEYDLKTYYDYKCDKVQCIMSLHMLGVPAFDNGYLSGDDLEGVNGIFQFNSGS